MPDGKIFAVLHKGGEGTLLSRSSPSDGKEYYFVLKPRFSINHAAHPRGAHGVSLAGVRRFIGLASLMICGVAHASNGLNQIGFGAESVAMGGADLAVARDTSALNTNPAGLSRISGSLLDMNLALGYVGGIRHRDALGNDVANSNDLVILNTMGYARHLGVLPVTLGIGVFAQGGAGSEFEDLTTAFGTRDDLRVRFRIARITPGAAWQLSENLSLGASMVLTYSDLEQDVFPDTSILGQSPAQSFFGAKITGLADLSTGIKLGLMYRPDERLRIGVAYTSQVDIAMNGGTLVADMSALDLGKVRYREVEAKGVDQPQELGLGLGYQYSGRLLLAAELTWIDWSKAVRRGRLAAADPSDPAAPASLELISTHDWRDQYVVALGAVYEVDSALCLRAGYNYGRNPIPRGHLNPLLAATAEHHLTLGMGWRLSPTWRVDGGLEWDIRNRVTYTNDELPFGEDAEEVGEVVALHFRLSRSW